MPFNFKKSGIFYTCFTSKAIKKTPTIQLQGLYTCVTPLQEPLRTPRRHKRLIKGMYSNYAAIFVRLDQNHHILSSTTLRTTTITYVYVSGDLEAKHCLTLPDSIQQVTIKKSFWERGTSQLNQIQGFMLSEHNHATALH